MRHTRLLALLLAACTLPTWACATLTGGITEDAIRRVDSPTRTPRAATAEPAETADASGGWDDLVTYRDAPINHTHVEDPSTGEGPKPPPLGPHSADWQNCGIYTEPVQVGHALHSMEHGAVWLTYRPDLPEDQVEELQDLVRGHDYVLMSPYPTQEIDVVMTAWGLQLDIPSLPDERVAEFIDRYEQGPQNPEPGAPCSGGVGTPEG